MTDHRTEIESLVSTFVVMASRGSLHQAATVIPMMIGKLLDMIEHHSALIGADMKSAWDSNLYLTNAVIKKIEDAVIPEAKVEPTEEASEKPVEAPSAEEAGVVANTPEDAADEAPSPASEEPADAPEDDGPKKAPKARKTKAD